MSVNKVLLLGNLGDDPQSKSFDNGDVVVEFSLATSESWVKDGEKHEKTEWHRVKVTGNSAKACAEYLSKGSKVFVEGKITYRTYEKDGEKKYITEIRADRVQFISTKSDDKPEKPSGGGGKKAPREIPFATADIGAEPGFEFPLVL